MEIYYKQFVIVPKKPKMSRGKIASQVAHATFMALEKQRDLSWRERTIIKEWKHNGMCVIILGCKDTHALTNIAKYFDEWNVPYGLCIDEGLTEVEPMTPTALATGVLTEDKFWIFEMMKLLK